MPSFLIQDAASFRLDEIYRYTHTQWGEQQADKYIEGMFEAFANISSHQALSRPVPAAFGVDGYFIRYEHHFIYWRWLSDGNIGIVTVLHEQRHQIDRFREDFDL